MISCLCETLNSFLIPTVLIETMYISLLSSSREQKKFSFVSPSFPGDLLLGIFFRASYSSLSVNSPYYSKHSLSENLGIWRGSKTFMCSDNVFFTLLLKRHLQKKKYLVFSCLRVSNLMVTSNKFIEFLQGTSNLWTGTLF